MSALRDLFVEQKASRHEFEKQIYRLQGAFRNDLFELEEKERLIVKGTTGGSANNNRIKPLPYFWLTVLRNVNPARKIIQDWDILILEYVIDVRFSDILIDLHLEGVKLQFEFSENPYFDNLILAKEFHLRRTNATRAAFAKQHDLEFVRTTGTVINWKLLRFEGILCDLSAKLEPRCRTLAVITGETTTSHR